MPICATRCWIFSLGDPGHRQAGDIALHVGHEHRHAQAREPLGQHQQRNGLAGAGGAGDQAVAVAVLGEQVNRLLALADEYLVHARPPWLRMLPVRVTRCNDAPARPRRRRIQEEGTWRLTMQPHVATFSGVKTVGIRDSRPPQRIRP